MKESFNLNSRLWTLWCRGVVLATLMGLGGCSCQEMRQNPENASGRAPKTEHDPHQVPDYSAIQVDRILVLSSEHKNAEKASTGKVIKKNSRVEGRFGIWVYDPAALGNKGHYVSGTSEGSSELFKIQMGKKQILKAWEESILGMSEGMKRTILIPAAKAYGDKGSEGVPPGAILLIEFEVMKIHET